MRAWRRCAVERAAQRAADRTDVMRDALETHKRAKPETLFHYAGKEAVHSILATGELWTAQIRLMRDSKEFIHAIDVIRELLLDFATKTDESSAKKVLANLGDKLSYLDDTVVLVACFSDRDRESQWRDYAPEGYALGFAPNRLDDSSQDDSYSLFPVFYEPQIHRELCFAAIQDSMNAFKGAIDLGLDEGEALDVSRIRFEVSLGIIAPLIKTTAFEEEHEWRLVSVPIHEETVT